MIPKAREVKREEEVSREIMGNNRDFVEGELVCVDVSRGKFTKRDMISTRGTSCIIARWVVAHAREEEQCSYLVDLEYNDINCSKIHQRRDNTI